VVDGTSVLGGAAVSGTRVLVIADDDRRAPLAIADHLVGVGHEVIVVQRTPDPSPQRGRYSNGSLLARLDAAGTTFIPMTRVTAIEPDAVQVANIYSGRSWRLEDIDTVVLVCGAVSQDRLYHELKGRHPQLHVLGDAYAPRRVSFATRQAWALASSLA
jgi:hypothetical protein